MKSKYLHIKSFHSILLIMIALLMNVSLSFAQEKMTKIKDGSAGATSETAIDYSILELESTTKGFLLPRMKTEDRNKIVITDQVRGNGLAIYNIDDDCINYWSLTANKWLSVCGSLPPATMELQNCGGIKLNASGQGELTQGRSLRDTDILYVSVKVIFSGSYTISAITDNGYSFSKSGVFETPGTYSIALEGFGTPMVDNPTTGDLVTFTLNGKKDTINCTGTRIKVKSSEIDYVVLNAIPFTWNAYKGIALDANDNKIELNVDVKTAGIWRIQSDKTNNGISISGSGEFTEDQVGKQVKVVLYTQGTPKEATNATFKFITNSKTNKNPNVTVDILTLEASFEFACNDMSKFEPRGEYQEASVLNKGNSITVPVKVINPGSIDIVLIGTFTGSGSTETVKFSAPKTFLGKAGEIQLVTLYPESKKVPLNTKEITFTGVEPIGVNLCQGFPTVPVKERSKVYTFNCAYISATGGSLRTNKTLVKGRDGILVTINVGYADSYNIKTNVVNGVSFEKSGIFTDGDRDKGTLEVLLDGTGIALEAGSFSYDITATDGTGKTVYTCSTMINFRGPDINVLAIGAAAYVPYGHSNYAPTDIITNTKLFGPNGKVKVNSIKLFTNSPYYNFPKNLASYLESNNIDIVIVGYPTRYGKEEREALVEFVKVKKGVVIMTDESNLDSNPNNIVIGTTNQLIADLGDGVYRAGLNGGPRNDGSHPYTMVNKVVGPTSDPIVTSTEFGTITNRMLGNDASGNLWYFKGLPSSYYEPIAVSLVDSSMVWIFKHKTLGFVFMGDGGIFSGRAGHRSDTIWPVAYDNSGNLQGKEYRYIDRTYQVYNSILYANTLKWAIDYIIKYK